MPANMLRQRQIVICTTGPVTAEALGRFFPKSEEAMSNDWRGDTVVQLQDVLAVLDARGESLAAARLSGVIALLESEDVMRVIDQNPTA